ncbi:WD40-repeat-containing domain protein [Massariosphaeria phaeospora]|uniref:ASTRA-associated protein 1 n=1 Tax=Massariosphaeria phaeospora TaxID=100035 RepID=A0A7C8IHV3_9PLEO|nr:WD40-repeat-containing domain protein [Massariosphaeria phaeospora]
MAVEPASPALPPAQPAYIFRGHTSQIHSLQFVRGNTRLVTGDADGWIVCWRLESKRPVAVWRAHDAAILGTAEWGPDKILTHGRDNTLRIWQTRPADEAQFSTLLPADGPTVHRSKPWLLHALPVNTLNFCAFSMCYARRAFDTASSNGGWHGRQGSVPPPGSSDSILVAVPGRDDKKIEVYQFPDEKLAFVVPRVQSTDTGMVMAVKITHHQPSGSILIIAGYEGGFTAVYLLGHNIQPTSGQSIPEFAQIIYLSQPHTQPILSLDVSSDAKTYFTSSADAVIALHRISNIPVGVGDEERSLRMKSNVDSPTANLSEYPGTSQPAPYTSISQGSASTSIAKVDGSQPSVTPSTMDESTRPNLTSNPTDPTRPSRSLATTESLDSSKKPSTDSSSLSFTKQAVKQTPTSHPQTNSKPSGISSLLSSAPELQKTKPLSLSSQNITAQPPHKIVQTKHAGQQSLHVRSDGRLLVTGGWDSRVRIYSTKTLKEMAVLKWHKESVYAVDFGAVLDPASVVPDAQQEPADDASTDKQKEDAVRREHGLGRLQRKREEQMQLKHWVAAGSKDGKVSLWEVF